MTDFITPPRELIEQWASEKCYDERDWLYEFHIAARAAQWGADQELEACCEWLKRKGWEYCPDPLRASRRPKPPSLKKQALNELAEWENVMDIAPDSPIRRALEQLND